MLCLMVLRFLVIVFCRLLNKATKKSSQYWHHSPVIPARKDDAKQKHLGCKNVRGQSEATLQTGRRNQKI